jgi:hypothetical protein
LDLYFHVTNTMQRTAAIRLDAAFQSAITRIRSRELSGFFANCSVSAKR